jgi:hypothetical protein
MRVYSEHLRPRLHMVALNDRMTGEVRDRVCAGLSGDVLEIGYGSGLNQPHLPAAVTGIWVVEPSATTLRLGEARRAASAVPVVVAGTCNAQCREGSTESDSSARWSTAGPRAPRMTTRRSRCGSPSAADRRARQSGVRSAAWAVGPATRGSGLMRFTMG